MVSSSLVATPVACGRLSTIHYRIQVTKIFGSKILECPHSSISGMLVWSTPPPPPMKIWSGLGTWDLSWYGVPPCKNENLTRLRDFGFEFVSSKPPSPPPKDLCCGSWCVETNRCFPQGYRLVYTVRQRLRQTFTQSLRYIALCGGVRGTTLTMTSSQKGKQFCRNRCGTV